MEHIDANKLAQLQRSMLARQNGAEAPPAAQPSHELAPIVEYARAPDASGLPAAGARPPAIQGSSR